MTLPALKDPPDMTLPAFIDPLDMTLPAFKDPPWSSEMNNRWPLYNDNNISSARTTSFFGNLDFGFGEKRPLPCMFLSHQTAKYSHVDLVTPSDYGIQQPSGIFTCTFSNVQQRIQYIKGKHMDRLIMEPYSGTGAAHPMLKELVDGSGELLKHISPESEALGDPLISKQHTILSFLMNYSMLGMRDALKRHDHHPRNNRIASMETLKWEQFDEPTYQEIKYHLKDISHLCYSRIGILLAKKNTKLYPHTADPPIAYYTIVPVCPKQSKSTRNTQQSANLSRDLFQNNIQYSALDAFVRAITSQQQLVLEVYKQTTYIAIAKAYIAQTALQIYSLSHCFNFFKHQNTVLFRSSISVMEGVDPEIQALFPELFPPQQPPISSETMSIQLSSELDTLFRSLFEEFIDPDPQIYTPQPSIISPPSSHTPQFPTHESIIYENFTSLFTDPEPYLSYTPTSASPAPPPSIPQAESSSGSSRSSPITTPEGSSSPCPEPQPNYCTYPNCNKGPFRRPCDLNKHLKTHNRAYFCKYKDKGCQMRAFSSKKDRWRHEQTVHEKKVPYTCPFCGKGKSRNDNLKDHIKRMHPNGATR